jgi:3-hydroxyacyl-CoA dehydrogenase
MIVRALFGNGMAAETGSGEQAEGLRYLSFAEAKAAQVAAIDGVRTRAVTSAGVVGAGQMGTGIALAFADAGIPVTLVTRNALSLERGQKRLRQIYERSVSAGRISAREAEMRLERITLSVDLASLANADLIIESVYEDMAVKTALLRELAEAARPDAILASNTSFLNLDALARSIARSGDVVGLHFFSPAHIMRLLEVVQGADTSPEALATALEIGKRLGKIPVMSKVGDGFIGNRIYTAYRNQCEFMLEEGAWPEQVDAALETFGFAMGPFAVGDLTGLDIAWKRRQQGAATRDARLRTPNILDALCEAGHLGQKTGSGWYQYEAGKRRGTPYDEARRLIEEASRRKGIARREFSDQEIIARAIGAMVNEAALLLDEGIAQRASDIDIVMVYGYGFPRHRGGPLFWASRQPRAEMVAALDMLQKATGFGFRRGAVERVLDEYGRF